MTKLHLSALAAASSLFITALGTAPATAAPDPQSVKDSAAAQAGAHPDHPTDPIKPMFHTLACNKGTSMPSKVILSTSNPFWKLKLPSGSASAIVPAGNVSWSAVPGAAWVGPAGAPTAVGDYTYTIKFNIAACPTKSKVSLAVQYRADNKGTLLVNGAVVKTQAGTNNYGFLPASLTTHTHNFPVGTTGVQTITLRVNNIGGPTGMAMNAVATRY